MTQTSSLIGRATKIRRDVISTMDIARVDQIRSEWRDALATNGIGLGPTEALAVFGTLQIVLFHLVDVEGNLQEFGQRIIDGVIAVAHELVP